MIVSIPGASDFAIVGVYMPPISSSRASWRLQLWAWAAAEYKRLSAKYNIVLCMGDFNSRLGVPPGMHRFTEDWQLPRHARPANREMTEWCSSLGLVPLHGRSLDSPGRTTCRSPNGTGQYTESDYILAPASLGGFTLPPMLTWESMPGAHVHRALVARVEVGHTGVSGPQRPAHTPRKQWHIPAPGDTEWHAMADTIMAALSAGAEATITSPTSTAAEAAAALGEALETGMTRHLQRPENSVRSTIHRRFHGTISVSPKAAAALQQARKLRRRAATINASPAATRNARLAAESMKRRAEKIQREGSRRARRELRHWQQKRIRDLRRARSRDAHAMFKALSTLSPDNPGVYAGDARIPDRNGVPATDVFLQHWRGLTEESRPTPPAATDEQWMQHVPVAAADDVGLPAAAPIDSDVSTMEVMRALFPPSRGRANVFTPCHVQCVPCKDYGDDLSRWQHGHTESAPVWNPCIHTSVAAGPDGIPAEAVRFPRPEIHEDRLPYRKRLATSFAAVLTRIMREGCVAPNMADVRMSPLLKSLKPGQQVDRGDPDYYRGIAVGNFLAKLLGVVLTARISHWAIRKGLLHPSQVGFLPRHSAEWHVLTVTQVIKARARAGQQTCALFVDLRKAYDTVHHEAMWAVLARMGLPRATIDLLQQWATARRARMRVNSEDSEPFCMEKGVPQGDPLSPLLFNLFLESLSRMLEADPALRGVSALGVSLKKLLYADDIAVLADSPQQLQYALSRIHNWCAAWGMEVSTGQGKTEAISFVNGQSDVEAATRFPPLRCGDAEVYWVTEYRYLGYLLRHDLDDSSAVKMLSGKLISNFERYFTRNGYVRGSSTMLKLQLYKTCVVGSINYLRSVIGLDHDVRQQLDSMVKCAARMMADLPAHSSTVLAWMRSRLLTAAGICARERERLRLQLLHTSYPNAIAARLMRALEAEPRTRLSLYGRYANWAHQLQDYRARELRHGALLGEPDGYGDIQRVCNVYGRDVAYLEVQRMMWKQHPRPPVLGIATALPPPSRGSAVHTAALHFNMASHPLSLGDRHGRTPVSINGPGCSGSLIAMADQRVFPAVARAQLGSEALHSPPFVERRQVEGNADADRYTERFEARACPLCNACEETIYHLVTECTHPSMTAYQAWLHPRVVVQARCIVEGAREALLKAHTAAAPLTPEEVTATSDLLSPLRVYTLDPASVSSRFLTYWMLMGVPWPRWVVVQSGLAAGLPQTFPLLSGMGSLFDTLNLQPRYLRPWAHQWLSWSEESLQELARVRRAALAVHVAPPAVPGHV